MKNLTFTIFLFTLMACNSSSEKKSIKSLEDTPNTIENKATQKPESSADYNSLLSNFKCDVTISELAQVLKVSEMDLNIPDYTLTTTLPHCLFNLKGFGKHRLNGGSELLFGPSPSTKAQNRKEISEYLKRKKEGLKIMGMDIELAETGDCYLAYQPAHGRVLILNENQSKFFLINYGAKNANTSRTKEQHEELRLKMRDLANYLLKKYRK